MGFGEAIGSVLTKYITFSGRASRAEFWWWWLTVWSIGLVFAGVAWGLGSGLFGEVIRAAYWVAWLFVIVPTAAVSIRRLHDTGKSGWFLLLSLIPIVNLVLLVFYLLPSDQGSNSYGPPHQ